MTEKETIKYLDLLFEKIEDFNTFSIQNIFFKEFKPNEKDKSEVEDFFDKVNSVKLFGTNNDLFIKFNDNGWYSLTEKGKEFKKSNLSFNKFEKKSAKKPLSKFEKLSVLGFIITFCYGIYQNRLSNNLGNQVVEFEVELDSLRNEVLKLNYRIDSLTYEFSKHYKSELLKKQIK